MSFAYLGTNIMESFLKPHTYKEAMESSNTTEWKPWNFSYKEAMESCNCHMEDKQALVNVFMK